jgi:hypothetical protein
MHSRHQRKASALYSIDNIYDQDSPQDLLPSYLTFDMHLGQQSEHPFSEPPNNFLKVERILPNKALATYAIPPTSEMCSFLSSSTENLVKEMNEFPNVPAESRPNTINSPLVELETVMKQIKECRKISEVKLNDLRSELKFKLNKLFGENKTTEVETEPRNNDVRNSGDTVQGPGSLIFTEEKGLIKFDLQCKKPEKTRKQVKFIAFS